MGKAGGAGQRVKALHQGFKLLAIERQLSGTKLQQFTFQQQTRQLPGWPLPATDPQLHRRLGTQQAVDPGVEFGAGIGRKVVKGKPPAQLAAFQQGE
ncbi:hypothetical protein D3C80_1716460 [compost metagenome]